jgi:hypothetical protein
MDKKNQHEFMTDLVTEMCWFKAKIDHILYGFEDDDVSKFLAKIEPRRPEIIVTYPQVIKDMKKMGLLYRS